MSNFKSIQIQKFSEMFKALSNPHRLSIFLRLASCCTAEPAKLTQTDREEYTCACVGDLGEKLEIVPSTVSHHIKELKHAGLIKMKRNGQQIHCWIEPDVLKELSEFFTCLVEG